jgi:DNA-binding MarR family transcriptional regulator
MALHHRRQTSASTEVHKQFRAIFNMAKPRIQPREPSCRISGAQLLALAVIARQPGLRISELAQAMIVHQTTASNLVERLAAQDMVEKRRLEHDLRVVCLYPLPAGMELIKQRALPTKSVLPEALSRLPPQKLSELQAILAELIGILYAREADGNVALPCP